jgi:hypothetical protein
MKKKVFSLVLCMIFHYAYGQTDSLGGLKLNRKYKILFIVISPGKNAIATENLFIKPAAVDSLDFLSPGNSEQICKIMKVAQVWVVKPALHTIFLDLNKIFNIYNIKRKNQHLPIRIDNWIIDEPETLMIDKSEILGVKIIYSSKYKLIDIKTRHPIIYPTQNK